MATIKRQAGTQERWSAGVEPTEAAAVPLLDARRGQGRLPSRP